MRGNSAFEGYDSREVNFMSKDMKLCDSIDIRGENAILSDEKGKSLSSKIVGFYPVHDKSIAVETKNNIYMAPMTDRQKSGHLNEVAELAESINKKFSDAGFKTRAEIKGTNLYINAPDPVASNPGNRVMSFGSPKELSGIIRSEMERWADDCHDRANTNMPSSERRKADSNRYLSVTDSFSPERIRIQSYEKDGSRIKATLENGQEIKTSSVKGIRNLGLSETEIKTANHTYIAPMSIADKMKTYDNISKTAKEINNIFDKRNISSHASVTDDGKIKVSGEMTYELDFSGKKTFGDNLREQVSEWDIALSPLTKGADMAPEKLFEIVNKTKPENEKDTGIMASAKEKSAVNDIKGFAMTHYLDKAPEKSREME